MAEEMVYLNGNKAPAARAALPIFDAGLVLGVTVTEQTRTFRRQPYRLDDHLDRLRAGLETLGIVIEQDRNTLRDAALELIGHNGRLLKPDDELGVCHFVTPGPYPTFAPADARSGPTVCVHTYRLPVERWTGKMKAGCKLVTTSVRDVPGACVPRGVKQRSRLHYFLADQEARRIDAEASALLLDADGHVTETSTANLLIVKKGRLLSPRGDMILRGISRDSVLRLARRQNFEVEERDLTVADVQSADEAFLTSTPFCMMPVAALNGHPIGTGARPVHEKLLRSWSDEVGVDIARQISMGT